MMAAFTLCSLASATLCNPTVVQTVQKCETDETVENNATLCNPTVHCKTVQTVAIQRNASSAVKIQWKLGATLDNGRHTHIITTLFSAFEKRMAHTHMVRYISVSIGKAHTHTHMLCLRIGKTDDTHRHTCTLYLSIGHRHMVRYISVSIGKVDGKHTHTCCISVLKNWIEHTTHTCCISPASHTHS